MKVVGAATICRYISTSIRGSPCKILTEINEATAQMLVSKPVLIVNMVYKKNAGT